MKTGSQGIFVYLFLAVVVSLAAAQTQAADLRKLLAYECKAVESCLSSREGCGKAFEEDAKDYPYNLIYTRTTDDLRTSFYFTLLSKKVPKGSQYDKALKEFAINLDYNLVANKAFVQSITPGTWVDGCSDVGKGYSWTGRELGNLWNKKPSEGVFSQTFKVVVYHESGSTAALWLTDICQQDIRIVNQDDETVADQPSERDGFPGSCLFTLKLQGTGQVGGFSFLEDRQFSESPENGAETPESPEFLPVQLPQVQLPCPEALDVCEDKLATCQTTSKNLADNVKALAAFDKTSVTAALQDLLPKDFLDDLVEALCTANNPFGQSPEIIPETPETPEGGWGTDDQQMPDEVAGEYVSQLIESGVTNLNG